VPRLPRQRQNTAGMGPGAARDAARDVALGDEASSVDKGRMPGSGSRDSRVEAARDMGLGYTRHAVISGAVAVGSA